MIKDVESLEKYLKEHEDRVLYLTKDSSGGFWHALCKGYSRYY